MEIITLYHCTFMKKLFLDIQTKHLNSNNHSIKVTPLSQHGGNFNHVEFGYKEEKFMSILFFSKSNKILFTLN
jgi:hypothetical protein